MKTLCTLAALLLTLTVASARTTPESTQPDAAQMQRIERNVTASLTHASAEVQASTIQLLIDMKSAWPGADLEYAVIPLMSILKNHDREELRILAALALRGFDSDRARFAVSQRALYDVSPRVARHCARLIKDWSRPVESPSLAQSF